MQTIINKTNPSPSSTKQQGVPPFSGTTLAQILQFVLPEDVARTSMVCKTWRDELKLPPPTKRQKNQLEEEESARVFVDVMDSQTIWKQAVINSSPNVMQTVIEATTTSNSGGETAATAAAEIDFHTLAKSGLGRKRKIPELPEPTFRIEDLLIVLELKRQTCIKDENGKERISIESLGSFSHNGSQNMLSYDTRGEVDFDLKKKKNESSAEVLLIEEINHLCRENYNDGEHGTLLWENAKSEFHELLEDYSLYDISVNPVELAGNKVFEQLLVSVTLFRRDDWRSICLLEDIALTCVDYDEPDEPAGRFVARAWPDWGSGPEEQPRHNDSSSLFARSIAGSVAREVMESKRIHTMGAMVTLKCDCVLPSPGAPDEPRWLEQLRLAASDTTEWTEQLNDDIAQVKSFQFRLDSVSLNLSRVTFIKRVSDLLRDPKAFLLLLEGIDWH